MQYERLESVLKRFSFEAKMGIAQAFSRQTFTPKGIVEPDKLRNIPSPWELETFVMLAVKAQEWVKDSFDRERAGIFEKIINCIRDQVPAVMESADGSGFLTWFFVVTASVQFEIQEHYPFKIFRFNYFFSFVNDKINMPQIFQQKFGCSYYEYALLGQMLWLGFSQGTFTQELFSAIAERFVIPFGYLTLTRDEYVKSLDTIASDSKDYLYCLRPSYSYPFISYEGVLHCPLPHLIRRATTSSLMHRLTDGDADLMTLIGKEVYEDYLYTIIKDSGIFDEVIPEKEYIFRRANRKTADVMTRIGDNYVFFDSKAFTPKVAIRVFSQEALDKDVERLAESVAQIYKHIRRKFPSEYCYFEQMPGYVADNIFGLVVVQENPYILGELIYKKAAEMLKISEESDEYAWLYTHVGITTIYDVERYCFTGTDMRGTLHRLRDEGKMSRAWLTDETPSKVIFRKGTEFIHQLNLDVISVIKEEAGIKNTAI